jgi:hypothetical protein
MSRCSRNATSFKKEVFEIAYLFYHGLMISALAQGRWVGICRLGGVVVKIKG